jgi:hypothetical protein
MTEARRDSPQPHRRRSAITVGHATSTWLDVGRTRLHHASSCSQAAAMIRAASFEDGGPSCREDGPGVRTTSDAGHHDAGHHEAVDVAGLGDGQGPTRPSRVSHPATERRALHVRCCRPASPGHGSVGWDVGSVRCVRSTVSGAGSSDWCTWIRVAPSLAVHVNRSTRGCGRKIR